MKVTRKAIAQCVETLLECGCRTATVYFDEDTIVRATSRFKPRRGQNTDIILTIGRPNFVERRFIRLCKKDGEPLPVRKVQVKWWPSAQKLSRV